MRYVSTRGTAPAVPFSQAVLDGIAPDGGLYVPERMPRVDPATLEGAPGWPELAAEFLRPFLAGDPLAARLDELCRTAFDFPLRLVRLRQDTGLLELYHGPTAAFKDFGARFLAGCLEALAAAEPRTVLVATSGDTGGAVAAALHRKAGIRVGVLFPKDGVSPRQARQLTCWGDNVRSFAVRGTFDDCQRLVKQAFADPAWRGSEALTSANSINIGRLLPQAAYYAAAALDWRRQAGSPAAGFVVPSGNLGNVTGAFWAKRLGLPVARIALATNANRVVPDWFETGRWEPRASRPTLANAMDVGDPSNMERLFALYPERAGLLADGLGRAVDDETIRRVIAAGPSRWGRVWCPHTATAVHVREQLDGGPWIVVATAHPAKFETIVEPLIGRPVELPAPLAALLARPTSVREIDPELRALRHGLEEAPR
ncbi:MAG TPA: threonine synthase [Candidatus Polarisedimenticolaceae bacterium]|nr:threonine synthase [Candidatus Polarisedimenticolaceae bacterium]